MSGIRTLDQLQNAMSQEFAWRKKELHSLKTLVLANEKTQHRDLFVRAAVTMLYAHWEGFVRQIGRSYLEFVGRKRLKHNELASHFLAMAVGSLVRGATESRKIQPCLDLVEFFKSELPSRSRLDWESGINTKANLKSAVFREIVLTLGLDYSHFSTKEKLIDEKLLNNRNKIAHGQFCLVAFEEYLTLQEELQAIMQGFYDQVENAAFSSAYRDG